ncbi:hypothetical protein PIROE2DRAFT_63470, partial [Piromyces sp. E2]
PLTLSYEMLHSNKLLLKKYNKRVPKTWNELLETAKEILEKERALNNTDLIGYNGLFFDAEIGICSIYEYFHSSRENADSPFPDLTSQNVLDAALLLKKIKNEISSGIREGVSSTILTGYNIGIANNMNKEKIEKAKEVVKFLTSREVQKFLVLQNHVISAITSIYEEEDVCASIRHCEMYRDAQPIAKPIDLTNDFNDYSFRFTEYFYQFLYKNENPSKLLKLMDDLARVYYINIDSKETPIGLITLIIFTVTIVLMLASLVLLHVRRYEENFNFLSKPSWVPKTWNELLETAKEILEKERALNNTDLIGYNGLFFDAEIGICSIYEYFHSSRENADSPFPDLTSQNVLDAALLLKKIKNEISSDEIFNSDLMYSYRRLLYGNAIFLKYFVYYFEMMRNDSPYELSILPGIREGVSSTILTGYNIGIANNMNKDKIEKAKEVVKFLTSRETQKFLVLQNHVISAITSIYEEEDVCASIRHCEMYRDAQPIAKPIDLTNDFIDYSFRFTEYFYQFLYKNENPSKILKLMDDLARVYYINIDSKETPIGLIIFILITVTICLMLASLVFLHARSYKGNFRFLSKPSCFFELENYILYFGLYEILYYITSVANYLTLYGIRITLPRFMNRKGELGEFNDVAPQESTFKTTNEVSITFSQSKSVASETDTFNNNNNTPTTSKSNISPIYSKILQYHNVKYNMRKE